MRIDREEFLKDLELVKGGLSPREFIEQSSCFVFQKGMVMTFNDEVACRKKVGLKITGAVQAQLLLDILGKLDDPSLEVRENEAGELEFEGKKKSFGLTKDAEIFLPIDRVESPSKWHQLPKEFIEAIEMVQHCVSSDESRFLLTCIHIHPDYIEACDNHQILRCKVQLGNKNPVLVRGTSLVQLITLGMDEVAMTKSWIHFRQSSAKDGDEQDGLVFSCRKYAEDYPSLDEALAVEDGRPVVLPKGMIEVSDRAAVFAADRTGDPLVVVTLKAGAIRIVGRGLSGWYKEVKGVTYDGPIIHFMIAPDLLGRISDKYKEAEITSTKLKVTAPGGQWEYVTVLGKPGDEEPEPKGEEEEPSKRKRKREED